MKKLIIQALCIISLVNLSYGYENSKETLILIPKNNQHKNHEDKNPFSNQDKILIIQEPFQNSSRSNYRNQITKEYMRENGIRQNNNNHYQEQYNKQDTQNEPEIIKNNCLILCEYRLSPFGFEFEFDKQTRLAIRL